MRPGLGGEGRRAAVCCLMLLDMLGPSLGGRGGMVLVNYYILLRKGYVLCTTTAR